MITYAYPKSCSFLILFNFMAIVRLAMSLYFSCYFIVTPDELRTDTCHTCHDADVE